MARYNNPSNTNAPSLTSQCLLSLVTSSLMCSSTLALSRSRPLPPSLWSLSPPSLTFKRLLSRALLHHHHLYLAVCTLSNTPLDSVLRVSVPSEMTVGASPAWNGDGTGLPSSPPAITTQLSDSLKYLMLSLHSLPTLLASSLSQSLICRTQPLQPSECLSCISIFPPSGTLTSSRAILVSLAAVLAIC